MLGKRDANLAESNFEVCAWQKNLDSDENCFLELLNLQKSRSEQLLQVSYLSAPYHQSLIDFDDQECCPARPLRIRKKSFEVFSEESLRSVDSTTLASTAVADEIFVGTQNFKSGNGSTVDDSDIRSVCPTVSFADTRDSNLNAITGGMSREAPRFFKTEPKIDLKCLAKFVKQVLDKEYPNPIYGNIIVNQVYDALTESNACERIPKSTYRKRISVILGVLQGCSVLNPRSRKVGRTSQFFFQNNPSPQPCFITSEQRSSIEEKLEAINLKRTQLNKLLDKKSDLERLIKRNKFATTVRVQELSENSSSAVPAFNPDDSASSAASNLSHCLGMCKSTGILRVAPDAEISIEKSCDGLTVLSSHPLLWFDAFDLLRSD
jgi:hypothetical protein